MTSWQPEHFLDDPDERSAAQWFSGYLARQAMRWIDEWIRQREHADPAWIAAADQSDLFMRMTPDQVRAMLTEVHEVFARHREAALAAERRGCGRGDIRLVRVLLYALPDLGSDS